MSIFDRFVSAFKGGRAPTGPLDMRPGDKVDYYDESFILTGLRVLNSEGPQVFLYCLKDEVGRKVVLAAVEGEVAEYSLQRFTDHEVRWEAERVEDLGEDEVFEFKAEGRARLQHVGDTWVRTAKQVDFRVYEDEASDQLLVLEDYNGERETRRAEPLYEGEFSVHREDVENDYEDFGGEQISEVPSGTAEIEIEAKKGSPQAAAMMLSREQPDDQSQEISQSEDEWSDAYDDDDWSDAEYDDMQLSKRSQWAKARAVSAAAAQSTAATTLAEGQSVFDTVVDDEADWDFI